MPSFVKNLLALPPRTKAILAVSAVAIVAILFFMLKLATAPSYTLLSSGLDPAQTGKITAALDSQGISYELRNNGTALAVNKAQVPQARIALASQGVEGVTGANVQLVLPEDTLFADEKSPATASVMLQNTADSLQPGAVRGIAQMTASSVKGLKTGDVTITDGSGQLLWPQGDGTAGATGGATKQAMEASKARELESKINA